VDDRDRMAGSFEIGADEGGQLGIVVRDENPGTHAQILPGEYEELVKVPATRR
jgi:hypothetical protein